MASADFENLEFYPLSGRIADQIWDITVRGRSCARRTASERTSPGGVVGVLTRTTNASCARRAAY